MGIPVYRKRLELLKKLLNQNNLSTQVELQNQLEKHGLKVNQSTISRDLRKLGTVKIVNQQGETVYRLSPEKTSPIGAASLSDLIIEIKNNHSLIVIQTTPGSASLLARHLDQTRPTGILGTIAGDDTIFVAFASNREAKSVIKEIETSFKVLEQV